MATISFVAGEQNPQQQRLREASFSFYLASGDTLSLRRGGAAHITVGSGRPSAAAPDDELDVFPAEKYFNGSIDLQQERPWKKNLSEYSFPRGQIIPSRSPKGEVRPRRKRFLRLFTCSSCSGEASVDVNEATGKRAASFRGAPPAAVAGVGEDDGISESSSELFEIESISTGTLFRMELSDGEVSPRRRRQAAASTIPAVRCGAAVGGETWPQMSNGLRVRRPI